MNGNPCCKDHAVPIHNVDEDNETQNTIQDPVAPQLAAETSSSENRDPETTLQTDIVSPQSHNPVSFDTADKSSVTPSHGRSSLTGPESMVSSYQVSSQAQSSTDDVGPVDPPDQQQQFTTTSSGSLTTVSTFSHNLSDTELTHSVTDNALLIAHGKEFMARKLEADDSSLSEGPGFELATVQTATDSSRLVALEEQLEQKQQQQQQQQTAPTPPSISSVSLSPMSPSSDNGSTTFASTTAEEVAAEGEDEHSESKTDVSVPDSKMDEL